MKKIFIIYLCSIIGINSFGQVSIGNALEPDSNVILDLTNGNNKGLLLPRTNPSPNKPLGNIFYNSNKNMIGVVVDTSANENYGVNYLSPWKHTDENSDVTFTSDIGKVIITNTDPANDGRVVLEVQDGSIEVLDGSINVNNGDLTVEDGDVDVANGKIKEEGNALLPTGVIVMFSGTTAPPGWVLCDGSSASNAAGAPNLKGRFIVGYDPLDGDYNAIGDVGGAKNHNHSLPNHNHTMNHNHSSFNVTVSPGGARGCAGVENGKNEYMDNNATATVGIDVPNFTGSTGNTNFTSNTSNGRPPFYTLAYIYKL